MQGQCNPILKYKMKRMSKYWQNRVRKSKKRLQLLIQFVSCEKQYQDNLRTAMEVGAVCLDRSISAQLFKNWQPIIDITDELLINLEKQKNSYDPHRTALGKIFFKWIDVWVLYEEYVESMPMLFQTLHEDSVEGMLSGIERTWDTDKWVSEAMKVLKRVSEYRPWMERYRECLYPAHVDYDDWNQFLAVYDQQVGRISKLVTYRPPQPIGDTLLSHIGNIPQNLSVHSFPLYFPFPCLLPSVTSTCTIYLISDHLIVLGANNKVVHPPVVLDENSWIREYPPLLFNEKGILYVCGRDFGIHVQILGGSLAVMEFLSVVQFYISMKKKSIRNSAPQITVNSIEHRNQDDHSDIYLSCVHELPDLGVRQPFLIRKATIQELEQHLHKLHPESRIRWFKEYPSSLKYQTQYERRKEYICFIAQQFLNTIWRCQNVQKKPQYVGWKLGLSEGIWQLMVNKDKCKCWMCESEKEDVEKIGYYNSLKGRNRCYHFLIELEKKKVRSTSPIDLAQALELMDAQNKNYQCLNDGMDGKTYIGEIDVNGYKLKMKKILKSTVFGSISRRADIPYGFWIQTAQKDLLPFYPQQSFYRAMTNYKGCKIMAIPWFQSNSKESLKSSQIESSIFEKNFTDLQLSIYELNKPIQLKAFLIDLIHNHEEKVTLQFAFEKLTIESEQINHQFVYKQIQCRCFSSILYIEYLKGGILKCLHLFLKYPMVAQRIINGYSFLHSIGFYSIIQ